VAVVGKRVKNTGKRQLYTKGETAHKTVQNTEYKKKKTYKTRK
jgi:hypothetical protein